jgi:hypothetical protein
MVAHIDLEPGFPAVLEGGTRLALRHGGSRVIIEDLMPEYDAIRTEHLVVDMPIERAWDATLNADFIETATSSKLARGLFALRTAGEKVVQTVTRKQPEPLPEPESMRLRDMPTEGDWIKLAEDPPHEIVFGVVGRFWAGETVWRKTDPELFRTFDEPRFARIAANFSLREYGPGKTLISYECRTSATSEDARKGFMRYWRPMSPFIGMVLRAQLRMIARAE